MAGLDPAIHVSGAIKKGVDARIKSGMTTTDSVQPDTHEVGRP